MSQESPQPLPEKDYKLVMPESDSLPDELEMTWSAGSGRPSLRETQEEMRAATPPDNLTRYEDTEHRLPGERDMTPDEKAIHDFGKEKSSDNLPN